MKDKDIKIRIREIVRSDSGRLRDLATKIGIQPEYLSSLLTGKQGVSASVYKGLAKYGISLDWLVTGKGSMFLSDNIDAIINESNKKELYQDWIRDKDDLIDLLKSENKRLKSKQNVRERGNMGT